MIALLAALALAQSPLVIDRYELGHEALEALPTAWSLNPVFDMLALPSVLSNLDTMGLSKPDQLKLSLYGDSNTQTRYRLGGVDISDPLHAGAPAFRVPFLAIGRMDLRYQENVDGTTGGVDFHLRDDVPSLQVAARGVLPHLGGVSAGAVELMKRTAGSHPFLVTPLPPSDRPGFDADVQLSMLGRERGWVYALDLDRGERRFLRFDAQRYAGMVPEAYLLGTALVENRALGLTFALDYSYRQRQNAEFFFGADETFARHAAAAFAGLRLPFTRLGLTLKVESDDASGIGFTRESRDVDGHALFPFTPRGTRAGAHFDASVEVPIHGVSNAFVHMSENLVAWAPSVSAWSNPILLDGVAQTPIAFRSAPTAYLYGEIEAGLRDRKRLAGFELGYSAYAIASHLLSVTLFDVGVKAHLQWRGTRWFMPYLAFSRTPQPLTQNVAEALDTAVLRGETPSDVTGDIALAKSLMLAKTHAFSLGWETRFSKDWRFFAMALAKTFDDTLWVRSSGGTRYALGNFPFPETPFYIGAHVQIVGSDPKRYFFMLGASAFFSLGTTAFGFGPLSNDVGIVDTTQAHPSARLFPQGNLEGDRAYTIKTGVGVRLVHTLWASLGIRYRDGRPFSYFDWQAQGGEVNVSYLEPKGSLYTLAGPREGARVNLDVKVSYTVPLPRAGLRLSALIGNAFDLAGPLVERQMPGGQNIRATLILEPPRMGMLSAELIFD